MGKRGRKGGGRVKAKELKNSIKNIWIFSWKFVWTKWVKLKGKISLVNLGPGQYPHFKNVGTTIYGFLSDSQHWHNLKPSNFLRGDSHSVQHYWKLAKVVGNSDFTTISSIFCDNLKYKSYQKLFVFKKLQIHQNKNNFQLIKFSKFHFHLICTSYSHKK